MLSDQGRQVWEKHMAPAVSANPGHTAYFLLFQQYRFRFNLGITGIPQKDSYAANLKEVGPFLSGPPQVTSRTRFCI